MARLYGFFSDETDYFYIDLISAGTKENNGLPISNVEIPFMLESSHDPTGKVAESLLVEMT